MKLTRINLTILFFTLFFFCSDNGRDNKFLDGITETKQDIFAPPHITVFADLPESLQPVKTLAKDLTQPQAMQNITSVTYSLLDPATQQLIPIEAQGEGLFTNYNTEQGLTLSTIIAAFCDSRGNLWFGGVEGSNSKYEARPSASAGTDGMIRRKRSEIYG